MTGIRFRGPVVPVVPTRGREGSSAAPKHLSTLPRHIVVFLGKVRSSKFEVQIVFFTGLLTPVADDHRHRHLAERPLTREQPDLEPASREILALGIAKRDVAAT